MNRDKNTTDTKSKIRRSVPKPLTTATITALKAGRILADGSIRPGYGSLKIRKRQTTSGTICEWLFEWSREKKTARYSIGRYCASESPDGLTLAQARVEAARLQVIVKSGGNPIEQREADLQAARALVEGKKAERLLANEKSLAALLAAYVEHLKEKGKIKSARDAENIFKNHILEPFPEVASLPAAQVVPEHFSVILTRLVRPADGQTKGRTALKLRSYAGAAYKMALGANIDPMVVSTAKDFGLHINPAGLIPVRNMAAKFKRPGKRFLSLSEFTAYLCHVTSLDDGLQKFALLLQIATGGQRMQQLLRITHASADATILKMLDPKGKRIEPRLHVLPILPEIEEILAALRLWNPPSADLSQDTPLFSSRGGIVALESISNAVQEISKAMLDKQLAVTPFRAGDIRRTIETLMAGEETLQISKDTRAQLLSHGISGVQDIHYDMSTHLPAKTTALRLWNDFVAGLCIGTNQVPD